MPLLPGHMRLTMTDELSKSFIQNELSSFLWLAMFFPQNELFQWTKFKILYSVIWICRNARSAVSTRCTHAPYDCTAILGPKRYSKNTNLRTTGLELHERTGKREIDWVHNGRRARGSVFVCKSAETHRSGDIVGFSPFHCTAHVARNFRAVPAN